MNTSKEKIKALIAGVLLMFAYGLISNTMGLFLMPVCEGLKCSRAEFNLYFTIMSAVTLLTAPFMSRIITKVRIESIMVAGAAAGAVSYLIFAASSSIKTFYLAAILLGIFQQAAASIAAVRVISGAFEDNVGLPMGAAMTGTGICATIMGFILPKLIRSYGWQAGYLLQAVLWAVLLLTAAALIHTNRKKAPSEKEKTENHNRDGEQAQDRRERRVPFILMFLCIICGSMTSIFIHHLSPWYQSCGMSAERAGQLVSLFSACSIAAKIILGKLYDMADKKIVAFTNILCLGIGVLLMLPGSGGMLLAGTIFFSYGASSITVLYPLVVRFLFGQKNYAADWTIMSMGVSIGTAAGSPLWGAIYDISGSYRPGMIVIPLLSCASAATVGILMKRREKLIDEK